MEIKLDKEQRAFIKHCFGIDDDELNQKISQFKEYLARPICSCDSALDASFCDKKNCRPIVDGVEIIHGRNCTCHTKR